jgi:glycerophosphoryl diester phosphodiesterase
MKTLMTDRLVEITFAPVATVAGWGQRLGLDVHNQEDGVIVLRNPHLNFTTAISDRLDPITRAICLASAIAGPFYWPQLCPKLLEAVNKEWKRRAGRMKEHQHRSDTPQTLPHQPTFAALYRPD